MDGSGKIRMGLMIFKANMRCGSFYENGIFPVPALLTRKKHSKMLNKDTKYTYFVVIDVCSCY